MVNWLVYLCRGSHYYSSEGSVIKLRLSKEPLMTPSSLIWQNFTTELSNSFWNAWNRCSQVVLDSGCLQNYKGPVLGRQRSSLASWKEGQAFCIAVILKSGVDKCRGSFFRSQEVWMKPPKGRFLFSSWCCFGFWGHLYISVSTVSFLLFCLCCREEGHRLHLTCWPILTGMCNSIFLTIIQLNFF